MDMAKRVVIDAKTDYPAACNAMVISVVSFSNHPMFIYLCQTVHKVFVLANLTFYILTYICFIMFLRKHFLYTRICQIMKDLMSLLQNSAAKV